MAAIAEPNLGIDPQRVYTLKEAKSLTGWGTWALRTARNNGLKVHYRGNRGFVSGRDLAAYLTGDSSDAATSA